MRLRLIGILAVLAMIMAFAAPVAANHGPNHGEGEADCPAGSTFLINVPGSDIVGLDEEDLPFELGTTDVFVTAFTLKEANELGSVTIRNDSSTPVRVALKAGSDQVGEASAVIAVGGSSTLSMSNLKGISNFSVCSAPPVTVTALPASVTPPTCTAAGTLVVPANTPSVSYSVSPAYTAGAIGPFTVTATANAGFVLTGTAMWNLTVLGPLTGVQCATSTTAAAATASPPSCTAAGRLSIPANTASVTYSVSPAYTAGATGTFTVTATANAGFVLAGTSQWTFTIAPQLTGAACVTGGGTLPGNPPSQAATPVRQGTLASSLPNTAMELSTDQLPAVLVAVLSLAGLAYVGRRNFDAIAHRR